MKDKQKTFPMELRSEKVRRIVGDIPNGLIYCGITIIIVIFTILIAVVLCVPYPYGNGESILRHVFR